MLQAKKFTEKNF